MKMADGVVIALFLIWELVKLIMLYSGIILIIELSGYGPDLAKRNIAIDNRNFVRLLIGFCVYMLVSTEMILAMSLSDRLRCGFLIFQLTTLGLFVGYLYLVKGKIISLGLIFIVLGGYLNLTAMVFNNGRMPVCLYDEYDGGEGRAISVYDKDNKLLFQKNNLKPKEIKKEINATRQLGEVVDVILQDETHTVFTHDTKLKILCDFIIVGNKSYHAIMSIGDLFIYLGTILFFVFALRLKYS